MILTRPAVLTRILNKQSSLRCELGSCRAEKSLGRISVSVLLCELGLCEVNSDVFSDVCVSEEGLVLIVSVVVSHQSVG